MADVGLSFSPTSEQNNYQRNQTGVGGGLSPVQDAIRILSFRVPQVLGAGAVSPLVGLGSQQTAGAAPIDSALMQEWLRRLLAGEAGGGFGSAGQAGTPMAPPGASGPPPTAPPPSVIINQPHPPPPMPSPGPSTAPSPFPGGSGGSGRPY